MRRRWGDEWSDIDLAFAIQGELPLALERWTDLLYRDFGAVHHWDLPFASTIYRVFLLPDALEDELRRALTEVAAAIAAELERTDPALASRLRPMWEALGFTQRE